MKVGIVVVNYGSHALVRDNFAWTAAAEHDDTVLVVVDNHKSARDAAALAEVVGDLGCAVVWNESNDGFGGGVNRGVAQAWRLGCDVVVLANPDLRVDAVAVSQLAARAVERPDAMISPLVVAPGGRAWARLGRVDVAGGRIWTRDGSGEPDGDGWLSGACLAASRAAWERAGGFDDDYFLYWEDVDLSARARRAGMRLEVLGDVRAVHEAGGTQDAGKSSAYYYFNTRNRLLFAAKNLTRGQRLRWLMTTPADTRRVLTRGDLAGPWDKLRRAGRPCLAGGLAGLAWMLGARGATQGLLLRWAGLGTSSAPVGAVSGQH